jgi:hypothetical protein
MVRINLVELYKNIQHNSCYQYVYNIYLTHKIPIIFVGNVLCYKYNEFRYTLNALNTKMSQEICEHYFKTSNMKNIVLLSKVFMDQFLDMFLQHRI